jgi:hypothetical protein
MLFLLGSFALSFAEREVREVRPGDGRGTGERMQLYP